MTNEFILNDSNMELLAFRGNDYKISDKISIHQPSLEEICEYGEKEYYSMVYMLCAVGADLKFQLYDLGIDYTEIDDFTLFYSLLCKSYTQKQTSIIFGDLDFSKFQVYKDVDTEDVFMYDIENDIKIDEYTYCLIVNVLRMIHNFKRNDDIPANETTKQILIEDAREEYERNKDKPHRSQLRNLISTLVNCEGFKYNHNEVWDMKIYAFMDSIKRISKIKNANLLLQSGYSGFGVNLKEINKKQIDWLGELD